MNHHVGGSERGKKIRTSFKLIRLALIASGLFLNNFCLAERRERCKKKILAKTQNETDFKKERKKRAMIHKKKAEKKSLVNFDPTASIFKIFFLRIINKN